MQVQILMMLVILNHTMKLQFLTCMLDTGDQYLQSWNVCINKLNKTNVVFARTSQQKLLIIQAVQKLDGIVAA